MQDLGSERYLRAASERVLPDTKQINLYRKGAASNFWDQKTAILVIQMKRTKI